MYEVEFTRSAEKELARLPKKTGGAITKKVRGLADEPRPRGCLKLQGHDDLWRIRVGEYRVIYSINDGRLTVLVVKVAHRSEAY